MKKTETITDILHRRMSEEVAARRAEKKMKQMDLAFAAGVDVRSIRMAERPDRGGISLDQRMRIAEQLGIKPSDFLR